MTTQTPTAVLGLWLSVEAYRPTSKKPLMKSI
jgi:hypothetical protein